MAKKSYKAYKLELEKIRKDLEEAKKALAIDIGNEVLRIHKDIESKEEFKKNYVVIDKESFIVLKTLYDKEVSKASESQNKETYTSSNINTNEEEEKLF